MSANASTWSGGRRGLVAIVLAVLVALPAIIVISPLASADEDCRYWNPHLAIWQRCALVEGQRDAGTGYEADWDKALEESGYPGANSGSTSGTGQQASGNQHTSEEDDGADDPCQRIGFENLCAFCRSNGETDCGTYFNLLMEGAATAAEVCRAADCARQVMLAYLVAMVSITDGTLPDAAKTEALLNDFDLTPGELRESYDAGLMIGRDSWLQLKDMYDNPNDHPSVFGAVVSQRLREYVLGPAMPKGNRA